MKGLDPRKRDADIRLLTTIRCETLDAFWSRKLNTVEATRRDSKKIVEISQSLGLDDTLPEMGSFVLNDTQGMGLAVCILIQLLDKGRQRSETFNNCFRHIDVISRGITTIYKL